MKYNLSSGTLNPTVLYDNVASTLLLVWTRLNAHDAWLPTATLLDASTSHSVSNRGHDIYDMYLRDILPPHSEMGQNSIDATAVNDVTLNSLPGKTRPDDFLTPLGSHFPSVKGLFPSKLAPNNITMSERQTDIQTDTGS